MSSHHQVVEYIRECSAFLRRMHRILDIEDKLLVDLQIIGDFSYAWFAIDNFTILMQDLIKVEPSSAIKLRALFLKVCSYQFFLKQRAGDIYGYYIMKFFFSFSFLQLWKLP